jgi:adenylate cyclase
LDIAGGEAQVRKALELDPRNQHALAWAGTIAEYRGQFDPAITYMQKAIEIDPANPIRYNDLARILSESGKFAEALIALRKAKDLNPTLDGYHTWVSALLLAQGDPTAALAENDRESDEKFRLNAVRVEILDALGRKVEADALLAQLGKTATNNAYDIACVYARRGEVDQAFKWLNHALKDDPSILIHIFIEPDLRGIHGDPRFKALLKKLPLF